MPVKVSISNQIHYRQDALDAQNFVRALQEEAKLNGVFDSAAATDFVVNAMNQTDSGVKVPEKLQVVLDEAKTEVGRSHIAKAVLDGISLYEQQHGTTPPADVLAQAVHHAYANTAFAADKFKLDSANSLHHDPLSLQPNRAVVSILAALNEAIPFAHYLPADIRSNEARLAIVSHRAGSTFGSYQDGGLMDGALSGQSFLSSARVHTSKPASSSGNITGKLTGVQNTPDTCDPSGSAIKLLRGRTLVYVNGMLAAKDHDTSGTGPSSVSGKIEIAGKAYAIGGTITPETGEYSLTTTPALPETVPVTVEGFIDYEKDEHLIPALVTSVETFSLFAQPWRVMARQSLDSRTQMANELNLDPASESTLAIHNQFASERHFEVLRKAMRLAVNNQMDYDFEWAARSQQMSRVQIWQDFAYALGAVSQQMALDTMSYGVSHLYVGKNVASQMMALPREVFEPSGLSERPGIFRIGRLFGRYEVYYTPRVVTETESASQILCIGRAHDVARNPFVLGDAVPPMMIGIPANQSGNQGVTFYARNFTAVNPHHPSSMGCAVINVTNLK